MPVFPLYGDRPIIYFTSFPLVRPLDSCPRRFLSRHINKHEPARTWTHTDAHGRTRPYRAGEDDTDTVVTTASVLCEGAGKNQDEHKTKREQIERMRVKLAVRMVADVGVLVLMLLMLLVLMLLILMVLVLIVLVVVLMAMVVAVRIELGR